MRFRLLGTLEVGDGALVRGARERKLLALLLLEAPAAVTRRAAADWVLGADRAPADPGLSVAVSRLRAQLREHDARASIERSPAGLRLVTDLETIDSVRFKRLLERARALPPDDAERRGLVREALALWRGEVLVGEDVAHHPAITELTELRFAALEERFEVESAVEDPRELAELLAWCRSNPQRERLWALAMRALYGNGRHVEALALYQEARSRLVDTMGLEPGPDLVEVERRILNHDPSLVRRRVERSALEQSPAEIYVAAPNLSSTGALSVAGNLPRPQSTFVARSEEVKRVADAVQHGQLVTLVGAGGMGKTRLSIEVAATLREEFPDGVWFVELAPLQQHDAVYHALNTTLSVAPEPGRPLLDAIVDRLAPQRALLVLDNCEHVLEPAAEIVAALGRAAPRLVVLATSREPLGVLGEQVVAVTPLAPRSEAVQLFCDRARAADHAFVAATEDIEVIGTICERLDGMPLAVELAASRVRSMSLSQLADRLTDRFRLLDASPRRGRPERHQTLRATVEWSYRLLGEQERILFDRLSVFSGSFDLEAVEAVCGIGPLEPDDVFELLSGLVDRSLVIFDKTPRVPRYRLLETLRQCAGEQLQARGEGDVLLDAHLAHFTRVATDAQRTFEGNACGAGAEQLARNWDDLRVALAWAAEQRDQERATAILDAATMFACFWFRFEVGDWAQLLIRRGLAGPAVHGCAALFAAFAADRDASLALSERGLARADTAEDPTTLHCWHSRLTVFAVTDGGSAAAFDAAEHMVAAAEGLPPSEGFWRAYAHMVAAWMHSLQRPSHASGLLERGLDLAAGLDNDLLNGYGQLVAGHLASAAGDKRRAMAHFEALAQVAETLGSPHLRVMTPWSIAHVAHALDDRDAVLAAYRSAVAWLYDVGDWVHLWPVIELFGAWAAQHGDPVLAAVILGHLDANEIAMSGYRRGRTRATAILAELASTPPALVLGRRLSRVQLVTHILDQLA